MPIKTQEAFKTPNRWDQKRTCPHYTVIKTPNTQKTAGEQQQAIYKAELTK